MRWATLLFALLAATAVAAPSPYKAPPVDHAATNYGAKPTMRHVAMGSLGSGFSKPMGLHQGAVGGPTIHGAVLNGTGTARRKR
jgi:hypothetical protein